MFYLSIYLYLSMSTSIPVRTSPSFCTAPLTHPHPPHVACPVLSSSARTLHPPCLHAARVVFTWFVHGGDGDHGGSWRILGGGVEGHAGAPCACVGEMGGGARG
jgi:hypothetical protein